MENEKEMWRPIQQGTYWISNLGRLKNREGKICGTFNKSPYGGKQRRHRQVWEAFFGPIPKGYEIHHINGNKADNRLINLELITTRQHRTIHSGKRVAAYDRDFNLITSFDSASRAAEFLGVSANAIARAARGETKTARGYIWKYI